MFDQSKDILDEWSKRFCLKVIHKSVQTLVYNSSSLEFYGELMEDNQNKSRKQTSFHFKNMKQGTIKSYPPVNYIFELERCIF